MKKIVFSVSLILLMAYGVKAQNKNQLSFQLSFNQVELAYQHNLFSPKLWGEAFIGTGNHDINSSFDDLAAGMRIGYDAFSNKKSMLGFNTFFSIYIPNNDYYNAATPVIGTGIRYTLVIGKSGKHNLFANTGFQYGKRDYRQEYSSEIINASTIGTFKVALLYFSLGYGFKF